MPLPSSLSRARRQQQTSTLTRLQFSDDSSSDTAIESKWWRKLFTASSQSPSGMTRNTSIPDSSSESEEQDNVDAYLEFLDRRYRRLHSDDKKEETQVKQQGSSLMKSKPFSAMEWLTNGGNNNSDVVTSTREQQADALYVLGVAGLASQKLLQKHHLPSNSSHSHQSRMASADTLSNDASAVTIDKVVELKEQIDDAIEVNEESDTKSLQTKLNHLVLNNILLPIVRVIYLAQRQKQLLIKMIQRQVSAMATRTTNGVVATFSRGPKSLLETLLAVGGGRRNILRTVATGYAAIVVFRPLLHAVFVEGLAFDPLIK